MKSTTQAVKPVLFVLTSHGLKGNTGEPTGFYLGEVTHPLAVLDAAGIPVEFASIDGGSRPSTASTSMTSLTVVTGTATASAKPSATRSASPMSPRKITRQSSLLAVMAQCGTSPQTRP